MLNTTRIRKSRDVWRSKAVSRHREIRNSKKREARLRDRYARLEKHLHQLKASYDALSTRYIQFETDNRELEKTREEGASLPPVIHLHQAHQIRILCILLVIKGVVSFRSVPRILKIFSLQHHFQAPWIPHFTSVINWTLRLGLAKLQGVGPQLEPWIALIDTSIDVSIKKALVVLRISMSALQERKGKAITLQDCQCIGIMVAETWNGETVEAALTNIFNQAGRPTAILKDGGRDLAKGVRLWRERNHARSVFVLDDIGHVVANALKTAYKGKSAFKKFISSITSGAAKLRQSDLAFLTPPKIRTKGRFQSIMHIAAWGEKILMLLGGQGRVAKGGLAYRLRCFLPGFSTHRPFIEAFATASRAVSDLLEQMKNHGLNQATYQRAQFMLTSLPTRSKVRKILDKWLRKHLAIQCRMGIKQLPLLVSSDIIESLFGKFKVVLQRNPKAEFNRIVLALPALCGTLGEFEIDKALNDVSHLDLKAWEKRNVIDSQALQRRTILPHNKSRVPKSVRVA